VNHWVCRPCLAPLGEVEVKSIGNGAERKCAVCGVTHPHRAVEMVDGAIADRAHAALCSKLQAVSA
jgi:hypothetical protein